MWSCRDQQVNELEAAGLVLNSSAQIRRSIATYNSLFYRSTAVTSIVDLHDPTESIHIAILREAAL
jgi:hypothetical protein